MFELVKLEGSEWVRPEAHARYIERLAGYVDAARSEDATWYIAVTAAHAQRVAGTYLGEDSLTVAVTSSAGAAAQPR